MSAYSVRADVGTIGGRLKSERMRLGLTQDDMAALANKSTTALGEWERNGSYPNALALAAFAAAGADVLFIVTGRHTPAETEASRAFPDVSLREALQVLDRNDPARRVFEALIGDTPLPARRRKR